MSDSAISSRILSQAAAQQRPQDDRLPLRTAFLIIGVSSAAMWFGIYSGVRWLFGA